MHESALGVGNREVDGLATDDVLVDGVEVPKVRWRTYDEPLEKGLVKVENVADVDDVCVYVVGPDLS